MSPSPSPKFPVISVPYDVLVPARLDGLLACGRHMSSDASSHGFMREICGHAAVKATSSFFGRISGV